MEYHGQRARLTRYDVMRTLVTALSKPFRWFVTVPEGPRTTWNVILWWELRRIPYNIVVGALGVISLATFFFFISNADALAPGEDAVEPIALLAAPFLVNIAYTAGWVVELVYRSSTGRKDTRIGPNLFLAGTGFSILVVFFPSAFWGIQWLIHTLG
jgi:hypothetical protein